MASVPSGSPVISGTWPRTCGSAPRVSPGAALAWSVGPAGSNCCVRALLARPLLEILEAELVVLLHALEAVLQLADLEVRLLELAGDGAQLLLEPVHADGEVGNRAGGLGNDDRGSPRVRNVGRRHGGADSLGESVCLELHLPEARRQVVKRAGKGRRAKADAEHGECRPAGKALKMAESDTEHDDGHLLPFQSGRTWL
ncbi:MAG: hypothetical protein R3D02_16335 [Hyphomicrobiales bacterium]